MTTGSFGLNPVADLPSKLKGGSMLNRAQKNEIISGLKQDLDSAKAVFLTNLIGITGSDSVQIRKDLRDAEAKVLVTKNTIFRIASEGTPFEALLKDLKGTNALAIAFNEAPAVAKVLYDASEDLDPVELKGGLLDGKELSVEEIKSLAKLPSRDEMLGTLLATFNAPVSAFVRVMEQIREQKADGADSPVEAAAPAEEPVVEAAPAEEAKKEEPAGEPEKPE